MAVYNLSDISANAAVVIAFKFDDRNESDSIILNTIDDTNINLSSTITEHPIVSGDMVADHMFKNPINMSIRGSFQFKSKSDNSLVDIQALFEKIKNEGVLCEIVKVIMPSSSYDLRIPRFTSRSNMVLQSISWTEKISSLTYNFSFRQVMIASVEEYDVDTDDLYLPNPSEPKMKSFATELLNWEEVDKTLYSSLMSFELMTDDFARHMQSLGATALAAIVGATIAIGVAGATGITSLVSSVLVACGCSGPPGWIAAAVIAAVTVVVIFAIAMYKRFKELHKTMKYRIQTFKTYKNEKKLRKEEERFIEFVDGIHKDIVNLDNSIMLYGISSEDEQQCILTLDDDIYTFEFVKNNTNQSWTVKVFDLDDNLQSETSLKSALTDVSECKLNNMLFRTSAGNQVYIFRLVEDDSKLTSYAIMHSKVDMTKFSDLLYDTIKNQLLR